MKGRRRGRERSAGSTATGRYGFPLTERKTRNPVWRCETALKANADRQSVPGASRGVGAMDPEWVADRLDGVEGTCEGSKARTAIGGCVRVAVQEPARRRALGE